MTERDPPRHEWARFQRALWPCGICRRSSRLRRAVCLADEAAIASPARTRPNLSLPGRRPEDRRRTSPQALLRHPHRQRGPPCLLLGESNSPACNGVEKVYSYNGPLPADIASDPRVKKFIDKVEHDQRTSEAEGRSPKTLVELTGRAISASRQGFRNARSALGGSSQPTDQPLTGEPLPLDQSPAPLAAENAPDGSLDAPRRQSSARSAASAVSPARATAASCRSSAIAAASRLAAHAR